MELINSHMTIEVRNMNTFLSSKMYMRNANSKSSTLCRGKE